MLTPARAILDADRPIPERQTAARLDAEHAAWIVWWSVPGRRFWALPTWTRVEAAIVDATDPRELVARMRQIERQIPMPCRP